MPAATISCSKHMGTAFLDIVPGEIGTILLQSQCNCLDNYTGTLQRGEKKKPIDKPAGPSLPEENQVCHWNAKRM